MSIFLLAGIGLTISGGIGIKNGSIRGWGEDKFIRRTYTRENNPLLFWAISGGKIAVGSAFILLSSSSMIMLKNKDS